jgi:hypothetical protein
MWNVDFGEKMAALRKKNLFFKQKFHKWAKNLPVPKTYECHRCNDAAAQYRASVNAIQIVPLRD